MKILYFIPLLSLAVSCSFTTSEFACDQGDSQAGKTCKNGVWVTATEGKDMATKTDTTSDMGGTTDIGTTDTGTTDTGTGDMSPDMATDVGPGICGDGMIDDGENCDGAFATTCVDLQFASGDLACTDQCKWDTTNCVAQATCGNGIHDAGEECDAGDLNAKNCTDVGFDGGTLACTDKCVFDSVACYKCGDNKKDPGEECDANDFGAETCADDGLLTCTNACKIKRDACFSCGDDVAEQTEICDGVDLQGQTCTSQDPTLIGTLQCAADCGSYDLNQCKPFFTQVSAGGQHSCGRKSDGSVVCWGSNNDGQRDNIPAGQYEYVGAGRKHTCGLLESGEIRCWGDDSDQRTSDAPAGIYTQLSVGLDHACALATAGTITCWGKSGDARTNPPGGTFDQISVLEGHGCALAAGVISCWGRSGSGRATPAQIGLVESVRVGRRFTCARVVGGTTRCWGDGSITPPNNSFSQLDANRYHICAIDSITGFAECWGSDSENQSTPPTPAVVYSQISAGTLHSCAVRIDGNIDCWGDQNAGKSTPPQL